VNRFYEGLSEEESFSVQDQELAGSADAVSDLASWHKVYEGLSEEEIADVEAIALGGTWFSRGDLE
jgi:hypothetical protein